MLTHTRAHSSTRTTHERVLSPISTLSLSPLTHARTRMHVHTTVLLEYTRQCVWSTLIGVRSRSEGGEYARVSGLRSPICAHSPPSLHSLPPLSLSLVSLSSPSLPPSLPPSHQEFVECAHPSATGVDVDSELRLRTAILVHFSGVPNHRRCPCQHTTGAVPSHSHRRCPCAVAVAA